MSVAVPRRRAGLEPDHKAECIRGLIEEIRLVPIDGKLTLQLFGVLGALLSLGNKAPALGERGRK